MSYCNVHQSPLSYYLLYLFIVDLSFTPGNIPALLFCAFGKQEDSKAQYLISSSAWVPSVLSHQWEAQFMTPKTASMPLCLAAAYQLCLVWACFIYWESGGSRKTMGRRWDVNRKVGDQFNKDIQCLCAARQALLASNRSRQLKLRETSAD